MSVFENIFKKDSTSKPEMEQVEQEKQEYKLIGKYVRTKGLMLFAYNSLKNTLSEVYIRPKDAIHVIPSEEGHLTTVDTGTEEASVDARDIHFEALNLANAKRRLAKWKAGTIKELCNLREPNKEGIKLF